MVCEENEALKEWCRIGDDGVHSEIVNVGKVEEGHDGLMLIGDWVT